MSAPRDRAPDGSKDAEPAAGQPSQLGRSALAIALGGAAVLAGAVGIGRFLFTPALPMMAEGTGLGPAAAGAIASANFAGYLVGALALSFGFSPLRPAGRGTLLAALACSAATTGLMAITDAPLWWAVLRALGGIASAVALVAGSSLVLTRLTEARQPGLIAVHFAGVGFGIALCAALASPLFAPADGWRVLWLSGAMASLGLLAIAALLLPSAKAQAVSAGSTGPLPAGLWRLAGAYGCLGFGYVVLATFLVVMLREGGWGRSAETWAWAGVGVAAAPSVALWSWAGRRIGTLPAFRLAMLLQAAGMALAASVPGALALGIAGIALGGTFMGQVALGLAEAGRRAGQAAGRAMAVMTASFGIGQLLGPILAGWAREASGGFTLPCLVATVVLIAGTALAGGSRPSRPTFSDTASR